MELSFTEILRSEQSREKKMKAIAEKIRATKNYSWIGLYDVKEDEIKIVSWAGRTEPAFSSFPKDKGLNGRAVIQGKTVVVNDIDQDEDYLLTFTNTKSEVVVPIFIGAGKRIRGTIDVEAETTNAFHEMDVRFLEDCASKISELWGGS